MGQGGLFSGTSLAFGALCTLKLDSKRCGVNLGDTRKSFGFNDPKTPISVFCRKFHELGIFSPWQSPVRLFIGLWMIVSHSIDSIQRYQHSGPISGVNP